MGWFSQQKAFNTRTIIGALIPSSGIFIVFSLYGHSEINASFLLLYFQSIIALVFGAVFFAPFWGTMPLKTEGEFIPYRFQGRGVLALSRFRGLYLGLLVLPISMALVIQPIVDYFFNDELTKQKFTLVALAILAVNIFFNSLKNRIRIDAAIGYSTLAVAILYFIQQLFFNGFQKTEHDGFQILEWSKHISGQEAFLAITVLWWFSRILDFPDMEGQKLLSLKQFKNTRKAIILAILFAYLIQGILISFPINIHNSINFSWVVWILLVLILLNAFQAMFSVQHWIGSLLYSGVIRPHLTHDRHEKRYAQITMFLSLLITAFWLSLNRSTSELFATILFFTAGVGPAFALRWFWSRINAFAIMSAMLGAPVVWLVWMQLKTTTFISATIQQFHLDEISVNVILPGILNTLLWLTVMLITYKKEEHEIAKLWVKEIDIASAFKNWKNWALFIAITILSGLILFGPSVIINQ
jgi:Na+/proline symporter